MIRRALALALILVLQPLRCLAAIQEYPEAGKMPSRYDMRDEGIVTPVKL